LKCKIKCEHCDNEADRDVSGGPHGIEEDHILCGCGYCYHYAYGNYWEQLPGKPAMTWTYNNPIKYPVHEDSFITQGARRFLKRLKERVFPALADDELPF
jgi:hypothetical protein